MKAAAPALAALLAACAAAPMADPARSLAQAETDFAAHSVREDMRAAFLEHFAPGGLMVRSGWESARDVLGPQPAPPIVLDWRPAYVEVSASGELGFSTGPWRRTARGSPDAPPAFGQFVSVWRRDAGGPWKVLADLGIAHAPAALWDAPLELRHLPAPPPASSAPGDAERAFAQASASRGARAAYEAHASGTLRLYRPGHAPWLGRDAALAADVLPAQPLSWVAERSGVSAASDLAYFLGRYEAADGARGWYLRVWRREAAGWRIALDVTHAAAR